MNSEESAAISYSQSCFHNNSDLDLHILDTTKSDIINIKLQTNQKLVSPFLRFFGDFISIKWLHKLNFLICFKFNLKFSSNKQNNFQGKFLSKNL